MKVVVDRVANQLTMSFITSVTKILHLNQDDQQNISYGQLPDFLLLNGVLIECTFLFETEMDHL